MLFNRITAGWRCSRKSLKGFVKACEVELLGRALVGAPAGFGNPFIFRLIEALRAAGSLYVKEKRVRILPRGVKKALDLSGLPRDVFENAMEAARAAGLIGRNSINEAGLMLLAAVRQMNSGAEGHKLEETD